MMRARFVVLSVAAVAVFASGCGSGVEGRAVAEVGVVDGEERWSYESSPANRLPWTLDTVAVIGDIFPDADTHQFDQVLPAGLAGDGEGNLYLLDRSGNRVLAFSPDGESLGTFGRAGSGPGELQQPLALALGPGDSIWVSDISNQRITIYPPTGGEPRNIAYPMNERMAPRELRMLGGDYLHVVEPALGLRAAGARRGPAEDGRPPADVPPFLARFSLDGALRDTIWEFSPPRRGVTERSEGDNANRFVGRVFMPRAFAPTRRWDLLSDGTVVLSDSAAYSIALVDVDGDLIRRIERGPPPRETTEEDRAAERERRATEMQQGGGVRITMNAGGPGGGPAAGPPAGAMTEMLANSFEDMRFEPVIPRITGLAVDASNRIWVGVSVDIPHEVERIDVYDADGTLLGELYDVPLPDRFLGPGLAAKLIRDELDVQRVMILRLDEHLEP